MFHTTEEKRSRMTAMCSSSQNGCDRCRLRSVCRKTGHPPKYMGDEVVEMVYTDAVKRGKIKED